MLPMPSLSNNHHNHRDYYPHPYWPGYESYYLPHQYQLGPLLYDIFNTGFLKYALKTYYS